VSAEALLPELAGASFARFLPRRAEAEPDAAALITPDGASWRRTSWGELEARSAALAHGLAGEGLVSGDRAVVLVRPGPDWVALIHALLRIGAVPVLIDPGMGRANLIACIRRIQPRAFIAIPRAHLLRLAAPSAFASVSLKVAVGAPRPWDTLSIEALARGAAGSPLASVEANDEAAILFTSGSTGPPKGVVYTHGMFNAQVRTLGALYGFRSGAADLACFPLFSLFNAGLEITSVLPEMDFSHPSRCDPARIVAAITEHRVETTFGSPAIWRRVMPWCRQRGQRLESLRQLMIAGAPVEPALVRTCREVLDGGDVYTPYGATEALPVASISGAEILERADEIEGGAGNCVGRPAPGIELRLIEITDEPVESWDLARKVPPGKPGEVCVRGLVVTGEYAADEGSTRAAKIADGDTFWHRMGDVGRLDASGRLWFLGRKAHRLQTQRGLVMPVPIENVFRRHPKVQRCALVGVGPPGEQRALLIVEAPGGCIPRARAARAALEDELLHFGSSHPVCRGVERVLFKRDFPLDVRHNAKIDRESLRDWAAAHAS
jgi:acyl-CoA synthetase (AMP-forming)/AMP-acid ligase II